MDHCRNEKYVFMFSLKLSHLKFFNNVYTMILVIFLNASAYKVFEMNVGVGNEIRLPSIGSKKQK